tara:strand:+ start:19884 stop:20615 length:732 start_codon:yes stop_codon:yes gene_type:complete
MSKYKFPKYLLFLLLIVTFYSFIGDKVQKRVIRDASFDTHFFVYIDKKKTDKEAFYSWYKSGEIHESFGDAGGDLLHDEFIKYYSNNSLAEKGKFNYGLKVGLWRKWHPNGTLIEETQWRAGKKNGSFLLYDQNGNLNIKGQYRRDIKNGTWINIQESDTTWYKKGIAYKEHPRIIKKRLDSINGKESLFKKIFKKKDSTDINENRKPFFKRVFSKQKDTTTVKENKPFFLKRWFTKDNDTDN